MIKFTTRLREEMDRNIRAVESVESDVLKRAYLTAKMLEELMERLKTFIMKYPFRDDTEEILFFREIKPYFSSRLLFHLKVYNIEMNRPMGSFELLTDYLNNELGHIAEYVRRRIDFYRYYRAGSTHRDHIYFKRGIVNLDGQYIDGFCFERDPAFSSCCDFTVAKILACDMLQAYLREELEQTGRNRLLFKPESGTLHDLIRWTDKKAGLIEVIYSLDTLGVFDNGELSLRRLQEYVETHCDVKLGNIARALNEMRLRRNPTMFLDRMKEALLKRMEEADNRAYGYCAGQSSFSKTDNRKQDFIKYR